MDRDIEVLVGKSHLGEDVRINPFEEEVIVYSILDKEKERAFMDILYTQLLKGKDVSGVQIYEYNNTEGYSWDSLKNSKVHLREKDQLLTDKSFYEGEGFNIVHIRDYQGIESVIRQYISEIQGGSFENTCIWVRAEKSIEGMVRLMEELGEYNITTKVYSGESGIVVGYKIFSIPLPIGAGDSEVIMKRKEDIIPRRVHLYKLIDTDKNRTFNKIEFEV